MELTVCKHIPHDECRLYGIGDTHLGSSDCDEELLERDIATIAKDDAARVILVGDIFQYDTKTSKGDVYHQKYPPSQQKKRARSLFEPIAHKSLAAMGGNHDEGRTQEDATPVEDLCEWLGIPYCDTEMFLKIPVGQGRNGKPCVYTLFATHGWTSSRTMGAKANALHNLRDIALADIYGIGHTHTMMAFPDTYYVPDLRNNNVLEVTMKFVNFGSYQKRGRYPKSKGLGPKVLGTPLIRLSGKERKVTVEI